MKSQNLQELKGSLKASYNGLEKSESEGIFDIMLFGSSVKGKLSYGDYDACIVFRRHEIRNLETTLSKFRAEGVHLAYTSLDNLLSEPLWLTLIAEGVSVLKDKPIAEILGLSGAMVFTYSLRSLATPSEKMKFCNAVRGRGGLLKKMGAVALGRGCVMVPMERSEEFRSVLEQWKLDYSARQGLFVR